jgi:hypothetical protein
MRFKVRLRTHHLEVVAQQRNATSRVTLLI